MTKNQKFGTFPFVFFLFCLFFVWLFAFGFFPAAFIYLIYVVVCDAQVVWNTFAILVDVPEVREYGGSSARRTTREPD